MAIINSRSYFIRIANQSRDCACCAAIHIIIYESKSRWDIYVLLQFRTCLVLTFSKCFSLNNLRNMCTVSFQFLLLLLKPLLFDMSIANAKMINCIKIYMFCVSIVHNQVSNSVQIVTKYFLRHTPFTEVYQNHLS